MSLYEFLRSHHREDSPKWLATITQHSVFPRDELFSSRIVYYPGSCTDGHPVKVFGSTHSAHCFVYVDYAVSQAQLEVELDDPLLGFLGYKSVARIPLQETDLVPDGWESHVNIEAMGSRTRSHVGKVSPYGFLEVVERQSGFGEDHGPSRLAILFLGADGFATYDALFCQGSSLGAPFAVLLQDHGFGGNYDKFGAGGLLEQLAERCQVKPTFLLVAENTSPWNGYSQIPGVAGDRGGMHSMIRTLYARSAGE